MDFHYERAKILSKLPSLRQKRRGTGAVPLDPAANLFAMAAVPQFAAMAPPLSASLARWVSVPYDQGQENSCVAYSIASMQSLIENLMIQRWLKFDAEEMYLSNGGASGSGISVISALGWDEGIGLRDSGTGRRYKISGYAFADPMTMEGADAIRQAISAQRPCVLAMLLPSDFDDQFGRSGDCNGEITHEYHQVCAMGYDAERVTFLNSWGPDWGDAGMGTVAWSYLQQPQQAGSAYAYTVTDSGITDPSTFALQAWSGSRPRHDVSGQLAHSTCRK